jgi:hypothetical protein
VKKLLLMLLPFIVGFSKPSHDFKEYFRNHDWPALRAILLMKAKNLNEMDEKLAKLNVVIREHEVCQQQLSMKSVPLKCFDVLQSEKSLGLITSEQLRGMFDLLDKVCEEAVRDIRTLEDLRFEGLKKRTISPKCRTALAQRFDILRYKAVESNPGAVFDLRWN